MMRGVLVVFALLVGWPMLADAVGVYRWVDANGHVHYSDTPVAQAERVNAALLKSRDVKPRPVDPVPPEFRARIATQCRLARDRVELYSRAGEVYENTATGVTYQLSPTKQRQRLTELRDAQKRVCRSGATERLWRAHLTAQAD